jgi:hypothetical protein
MSAAKAVEELERARRRAGLASKAELTQMEMVQVAIAYNSGAYIPSKGLKQGFQNTAGQFYGELILQYLETAQKVRVAGS